MTLDQIKQLRELLAKATPRPWYSRADNCDVYATKVNPHTLVVEAQDSDTGANDAALIVAAVNALPELLDELEACLIGQSLAGDPSKWDHQAQIDGLRQQRDAAEKRAAEAERESKQQFEQSFEMCRARNAQTRKLEAANARAERFRLTLSDISNLKFCEADPVERMFDVAKRLALAALADSAPDAGKTSEAERGAWLVNDRDADGLDPDEIDAAKTEKEGP